MSNVIIVGCGRVGSQLANMLSDSGHNVCCIDRSANAFANLGRNFNGSIVQGIGFDEESLIRAGVEDCDVVAAVTQYDNANLMTAEVARRLFGVPHVVARLYNSGRERAYMQLGIDYVCGTSLVAEEIFGKVMSGHGSHVKTFGDCEVLEFSMYLNGSDSLSGVRVGDLERAHEVRIIAFERGDKSSSSIPTPDSMLYNGDTVLAVVRQDYLPQFARFMRNQTRGSSEAEGSNGRTGGSVDAGKASGDAGAGVAVRDAESTEE